MIRRNWKSRVKRLWPDYTRIGSICFKPNHLWEYYKWRNKKGTLITTYPELTQEWEKLKDISMKSKGIGIPKIIKQEPILLLLFLIVYPFRINSEAVRLLDSKLEDI